MLWTECFCPPKSYVKALIPNVMVYGIILGGRVYGRYLGLNEVMRVEPHDGISALIKRDTLFSSLPLFPLLHAKIQQEGSCLQTR